MFLSSRWGRPSYEIEALPASEFEKQYFFWQWYKWGLEDDMLAQVASQILSLRTGERPFSDAFAWKSAALEKCGLPFVRLNRSFKAINRRIRAGLMAMVSAIGRRKSGKDDSPNSGHDDSGHGGGNASVRGSGEADR